MEPHDDILVIGGGVIGVCSAYYLAEKGQRVTLVEQSGIAAGSSYGNAGLIVPSHSIPLAALGVLTQGLRWLLDPESPFYIKPRFDFALFGWLLRFAGASREGPMRQAIPVLRDLGQASLALFDELAALDGLEFGYERKGSLLIYTTRRGYESGVEEAHLLNEFDVAAQPLDAAQVRQLEPNVLPGITGGVYFPTDTHLRPADFVQRLAAHAEKMGACIRTKTEVLGFETSGRKVVRVKTTRGDFVPAQVVLAAGAWTPAVARDLRLRVPIQAAKGYSITIRRPDKSPAIPLLLGEARVAVTPMGDVLRLAGTLEFAGLDLSINSRRVAAIQRAAKSYLPGLERIEPLEIWRGLRPCTPDGLPIVGQARGFDNLIVAAGHAMVGMTLGPITGKLVAQLVCGEKTDVNVRALRLERF
ncbi:MAG TPA: FAD-dependent oxidoreductase [Anaerolineae bacterium]|nr:FAD-dependent oxidoreductase [Anaerolineae bacterium]